MTDLNVCMSGIFLYFTHFQIYPPFIRSFVRLLHRYLTDHGNDENKDIKQNDNEAEKCHESVDNVSTKTADNQQEQLLESEQKQDNKANEQIANDTNEARDTIDKNPIKQQEATTATAAATKNTATRNSSSNEETLQMEEEQKLKKQKVSYLPKIERRKKKTVICFPF